MNDLTLPVPAEVTPTSLTLPPNLELDEWGRLGEFFHTIASSYQDKLPWYIGYWQNYGERYGEQASQYLELAYTKGHLHNCAWVEISAGVS